MRISDWSSDVCSSDLLNALAGLTITIDCDLLQADGGTRTAAIPGGYVALVDALTAMKKSGKPTKNPLFGQNAAESVGIHEGKPVLQLVYLEDPRLERTDERRLRDDWVREGIYWW